MTNEITLQLWILLVCLVAVVLLITCVFVTVLACLNHKWKKAFLNLNNDLLLTIKLENELVKDENRKLKEFEGKLAQDLRKSVAILKLKKQETDNDIVEIWCGSKHIPVLMERYEQYYEWLYPTNNTEIASSDTETQE